MLVSTSSTLVAELKPRLRRHRLGDQDYVSTSSALVAELKPGAEGVRRSVALTVSTSDELVAELKRPTDPKRLHQPGELIRSAWSSGH